MKIIADKLEPDTWYFYRYYSDIGCTRTFLISATPNNNHNDDYDRSREQVRFGFGSCSPCEYGYFNTFGDLADMAKSNHNCYGCSGSSSAEENEEKRDKEMMWGGLIMLWWGDDYIYEDGDSE